MKHEELITRYLDRQMTGEEEQNFLISLAASDSLRHAFRSHLELNNLVQLDKNEISSAAGVRTRTFAALGLSTTALDHYLEPNHLNPPTSPAPNISGQVGSGAFGAMKLHLLSLVAGLGLGVIGGIGVYQLMDSAPAQNTPTTISAPATNPLENSTSQPSTNVEATNEHSPVTTIAPQTAAQPTQSAKRTANPVQNRVNDVVQPETKSVATGLSDGKISDTNSLVPKRTKGGIRVNPTILAP